LGSPPPPPPPANTIFDCFEDPQKALTQNINNGANIDIRQKEGWRVEGGGGRGGEDCANKAKYYMSQEF